jgi:hypothetical protein
VYVFIAAGMCLPSRCPAKFGRVRYRSTDEVFHEPLSYFQDKENRLKLRIYLAINNATDIVYDVTEQAGIAASP